MRRIVGFMFVAALAAAVPANAQDKTVHLNLGGGYTFSLSDVRKHLGDGYNFNAGLTFDVAPAVSVQAEYGFTGLGDKSISVPGILPTDAPTVLTGSMDMHHGDVNLVFRSHSSGKAKPYFLAGVGVYHRTVKVTTPSVGYVPGYCDPWWYICYPGGLVPVDKVLGSRSSTDFGMNFGGGVNVELSDAASLYFEIRYHYIWGPDVTDSNGKGYGKANGQFLPLTFGIRF
jgi:opacity protein-like surface antigen